MEDHDISPSLMARAQFEDSRRRWRRNAFWRGVLVTFGVLIALGAVGAWLGAGRHFSPHIAHVSIHGTIFDEPARTALLRDLRDAETAKAVLLDIDSPGGTTVGAETIYLLMREIAETRPVVAVLGEVAASGGYVAALSADHVVARGNTLTGSIGVIMEYPNMTSLLERVGVEVETVRSSPLKAEPSPFRTPNAAGTAAQEALVADAFAWFEGLVAERRDLAGADLAAVTDGRVMTGRMALDAGLIDAIGGRETALDWLQNEDETLRDLPVYEWAPEREAAGLLPGVTAWMLKLGGIANPSGKTGPKLLSILN